MDNSIKIIECRNCDGNGFVSKFSDDLIDSCTKKRCCKHCNGTGIDKSYNRFQYLGESVYYCGRIAIFLEVVTKELSLLQIGKEKRLVFTSQVDFMNLWPVLSVQKTFDNEDSL